MEIENEILYLNSNELFKMKEFVDKELMILPEGSLNIKKRKNQFQYNHIIYKNRKRKVYYIPHSNIQLAKKLAQKSYYIKIKKYIDGIIDKTRNLNIVLIDKEIHKIYNQLPDCRKALTIPIKPTFNQVLNKWILETYERPKFNNENLRILTKKGEKVRSKTEKIIADSLFDKGIYYKYEKPINLIGMGTVYPDFILLSPRNHKEIIWEHFGMMDDPEYCENALKKIRCYRENGYYIGENLIVTFESKNQILDIAEIEDYINKYLMY